MSQGMSVEQRIEIILSLWDSFNEEEADAFVKAMVARDPNDVKVLYNLLKNQDCVDENTNILHSSHRTMLDDIHIFLTEEASGEEAEGLAQDLDYFIQEEVEWRG